MMDEATRTLGARWIMPISAPPLENGTITIQGGRIVAVEAAGKRKPDLFNEDAVILPGLVNAHTHLDLGGMAGKCPPSRDFTSWLRAVVGHRLTSTPQEIEQTIEAGLAQSLVHGVTLVGDIRNQGLGYVSDGPVRVVVFREMIGSSEERARQVEADACRWLESKPTFAGLSPHAPYSTGRSLYESAAKLAKRFGVPLATHLAESEDELELLESRSGPFVDFLKDLGVWNPQALFESAASIIHTCAAVPTLYIHANYLPTDCAIPPHSSVVYCPRTHAAFGHREYPLRRFLQEGVRVALGTDSLASNPDLDILAEARFVRQRFPDVSGEAICRMMTLSGAEALGLGSVTGSIEVGKRADLAVIPIHGAGDPYERVLRPG
jgi:cytosine/adenosine deaminase-related metal-dependent hydrolase